MTTKGFRALIALCVFSVTCILLPLAEAGEAVQLRILYVNDFHGFAEPYRPSGSKAFMGGIAYLADELERQRQGRPTLFLAAGDMIQGNPWANLFEGRSSMEVMNSMNVSAMVLGNHEFDFGPKVLGARIQEARFPILAANVREIPKISPYIFKEIAGLKIAIIGLITEETPTSTHPKNVQGLIFSPAVDTCQKALKEIGAQADLVIVLSHLGLPADIRLAQAVDGVPLIVGGHSHTRIESPMKIKDTLIVQAWEHAKVLGLLDLTFQDRKIIRYEGRLIPIAPDKQQPDPRVKEIVARYSQEAAAVLDEVIGQALLDLSAQGARTQETNLGNLVADVLRKETQSDVALTNGGGLRTDILKGPVRMKDLFAVLPFTNYPVVLKVTGRELKAIFEYGLSDAGGGRFPQVSGVRIIFDPAAPAGQKITSFFVGEKPLSPETWYSLATNDFLAAGGDGYALLKQIALLKEGDPPKENRVLLFDTGRELRDLMVSYVKEKKQISASVEGRIQRKE
ncbi:MAG: 5'-nucleotidase C-terminal domain-containing protein [Thermodesulfobacteriota bacterium]